MRNKGHLDCCVGAPHILIIICNVFAFLNRNTPSCRTTKVFNTCPSCCCCGCGCCGCCGCGCCCCVVVVVLLLLLCCCCLQVFMVSLLLQSHQSHHVLAILSCHHLSLVDCLHLLLDSCCCVSFRVSIGNSRQNGKKSAIHILYFCRSDFRDSLVEFILVLKDRFSVLAFAPAC